MMMMERIGAFLTSNRISFTKRYENLNTMVSFIWWLVGFYWMVSRGEVLLHNAPRLYWLTVVFLAFDVFFAIFCVVLACLIGIALCCCLPCIIAILYAVAGQEGASESDCKRRNVVWNFSSNGRLIRTSRSHEQAEVMNTLSFTLSHSSSSPSKNSKKSFCSSRLSPFLWLKCT